MIKEQLIQPSQLSTSQREIRRFGLNGEQPLFALTSSGEVVESGDLRVSTIGELLEKVDCLLQEPEATFCEDVLSRILTTSTSNIVRLEPQALLSPSEFEGYASRFKSGNAFLNPAEDVYVLVDENDQITAYGSRSSICPPLANTPKFSERLMVNKNEPVCTGGIQPCLRQEVDIDDGKVRYPWFTQTDIELVAITDQNQRELQEFQFDAYSCYQMVASLLVAGVPVQNTRLRVNNYMEIIVPVLAEKVPWLEIEKFGYQALNELATRRTLDQGIKSNEYQELQAAALDQLKKLRQSYEPPETTVNFFNELIRNEVYNFEQLPQDLRTKAESAYKRLVSIVDLINKIFGENIASIDCLSYRGGYPGYDKTTMQVDILTPDGQVAAEVGGGGAYPQPMQAAARVLSDEFLAQSDVYAVGFALGNTRLYRAMEKFSQSPKVDLKTSILSWDEFIKLC